MRNLGLLDIYRDTRPEVVAFFGGIGDAESGAFEVPFEGQMLRVIASVGMGLDHVSVSLRNRCPNWREMEHVKRLFFKDDETAMQLHVPPADHVNCCETCLHLWRSLTQEIPRPPAVLVGGGPGR